jgi:hypothetical protein
VGLQRQTYSLIKQAMSSPALNIVQVQHSTQPWRKARTTARREHKLTCCIRKSMLVDM